MEGGGGEHLQRAHGCLGPWLVPGRSTRKQSEFGDFSHSFIHSSFNRTDIFVSCYSVPGIVLALGIKDKKNQKVCSFMEMTI